MNLNTISDTYYVLFPRGGQVSVSQMLLKQNLAVIKSFETVIFFQATLAEFYSFLLNCPVASRMGRIIAFRDNLDKTMPAAERLAILDDMLDETDWPTVLPEFNVQVKVKASYGLSIHEQVTEKRVSQKIIPAYLRDEDSRDAGSHLRVTMGDEYLWYALEAAQGVIYPRLSPSRAKAALKEGLAALIAAESLKEVLQDKQEHDVNLVLDPMCGSGTFLIETAATFAGVPRPEPRGLCLSSWPDYDDQAWQDALDLHSHKMASKSGVLKAIGFDTAQDAIKASYENRRAFAHWGHKAKAVNMHIERRDIAQEWPIQTQGRTLIVMNPPYGKRIGAGSNLAFFYQALGERLQEYSNTIIAAGGLEPAYTIISSDIELLDALRLPYGSQTRLFNGPDPIFRRTGFIAAKKRPIRAPLRPDVADLEQLCKNPLFVKDLAQRMSKNFKKMSKFLKNPAASSGLGMSTALLTSLGLESWPSTNKEQPLRLFRLYNADIPEFNCAIDVYEHGVYLQEYKAPAKVDAQKAAYRIEQIKHTVSAILHIPAHRILTQSRQRQLGKEQYQRQQQQLKAQRQETDERPGPLDGWHRLKHVFTMREWGAQYIVNLGDYIDTGLFLDHRRLRWLIRHISAHKHVLNLFSYTGSMSVQAALGGAASTTSVDLSPRYTAWTEHNFMVNGLGLERNKAMRADVVSWLESHTHQYDLILIDPPTFSNSKKAADFMVQEHHEDLIREAMKHLQGNGHLFFSCNMKKFTLARGVVDDFQVEEVSRWTQSQDFQGKTGQSQAGGHRCWVIQQRC